MQQVNCMYKALLETHSSFNKFIKMMILYVAEVDDVYEAVSVMLM